MNKCNSASACLLVAAVAASVVPNGWAHDQQAGAHRGTSDQQSRVPNIVIVPRANAVTAPFTNPPVWIPGTIPGQTPQIWFPAMPPASNMDNANQGGVLSGPPANAVNVLPRHETLPGNLSHEERQSLDLACGNPEVQGVAAYRQCVTGQMNVLRAAGQRPNLNILSPSERSSVEQACVDAKRQGPASYNRCRAVHAQNVHHWPAQ